MHLRLHSSQGIVFWIRGLSALFPAVEKYGELWVVAAKGKL
jgi:hypothetical protein